MNQVKSSQVMITPTDGSQHKRESNLKTLSWDFYRKLYLLFSKCTVEVSYFPNLVSCRQALSVLYASMRLMPLKVFCRARMVCGVLNQ